MEGGAKYVVGSQLVFSQEDVIRHLNITFWKGKMESVEEGIGGICLGIRQNLLKC